MKKTNKRFMNTMAVTVGVVLGVCVLCVAIFWFLVRTSPNDVPQGRAQYDKYSDSVIEPVTFYAKKCPHSANRIARKGLVFRKVGARATVLICHGFMCDKTDVRFLRSMFHDYNVMLFDFRAHGETSADQLCTFGCNEVFDIRGAVDYIKTDEQLSNVPLVVYAFSMGAVSSINAQSQDGSLFDAAIWDCPFDSTQGLIARSIDGLTVTILGHTFPMPGRSFLKKYAYNRYVQALIKVTLRAISQIETGHVNTQMVPVNTAEVIKKVDIPAFFITCKNDEKAPPEAVRSVYENKVGYKRYWITNGRRHYDSFMWDPEKYTYKVRSFVKKFLDGELARKAQEKSYQDAPDIFERAD